MPLKLDQRVEHHLRRIIAKSPLQPLNATPHRAGNLVQPRPHLVHRDQLLPQPLQFYFLLPRPHRPVFLERGRVAPSRKQRVLDAHPLRPLPQHNSVDQLRQMHQHPTPALPHRSGRQPRANLVDKSRLAEPHGPRRRGL